MKRLAIIITAACVAIISAAVLVVRSDAQQPGPPTGTLELVSRELAVPAAELSAWRDAFLAAGEAALKTRPADGRDAEIGRLKVKVGDLTMTNELLEVKIAHLEAGRPLPRRRSRR